MRRRIRRVALLAAPGPALGALAEAAAPTVTLKDPASSITRSTAGASPGVANVATEDRPSPYGAFFWETHISVIGVPDDGDPTVGAGLWLVWRSRNPSGAIARRSEAARQIPDRGRPDLARRGRVPLPHRRPAEP